jgi:hypothetical protein
MPTLLRVEGFRFYYFSEERQEPPHVHVRKGDSVAKLWLLPSHAPSAAPSSGASGS